MHPPSLPAPSIVPGTQIGLYEVEQLISRGGFGAVYRVTRDGQPFALKLPLAGAAKPAEERGMTETRICREVVSLMTLDHPNIVKVHAFDRWPDPKTGSLYLVMDFIEGVPLLDWRKNEHPTLRGLVELFQALAQAVDAMHKLGVIHRDLKSSNVLVTPNKDRSSGPAWTPVIVDFGLARPAFTPDVTREFVLVGTEGYWSPEHAAFVGTTAFTRGERFKFTPATELHALGLLFYRALTGLPAFRNDSSDFDAVLRALPRPPSVVSASIPDSLDAPLLRLLAKNPAGRTASGAELADELEALLSSTDACWDRALPAPTLVESAGASTPTSPQRPRLLAPVAKGTAGSTADVEPPTAPIAAPPVAPVPVESPVPDTRRIVRPTTAPRWVPPKKLTRVVLSSIACSVALLFGWAMGMLLGGWRPTPAATRPAPVFAAATTATTTARSVRSRVAAPVATVATVAVPARELHAWPPVLIPAPVPVQQLVGRASPTVETRKGLRVPTTLVRAALVSRAEPGPTRAVLRQPVALGVAALPTGTTLDGTADELPDGRYLLRFAKAERKDGSTLPVDASAVVEASAAARHPLKPGATPPGFEFDLTLGATP